MIQLGLSTSGLRQWWESAADEPEGLVIATCEGLMQSEAGLSFTITDVKHQAVDLQLMSGSHIGPA